MTDELTRAHETHQRDHGEDKVCAHCARRGFLRALSRVEELIAGSRETGVSIADVLEDLRKESHGR